MDFYHKKSFTPNPIAMKLSSFHKQQGHIINFVTDEYHINLSYDKFYIIKEKVSTPKPPGKLLHDKRVKLIGKPLRFFDNYYEIDPVISAVRPDYMLYPENKRDPYYNANIVQFFHKGKKLQKIQPFENTKAFHKKTLVVDEDFWDADSEDIILCLEELREYKNIAFLYPISLKVIMENKKISRKFIRLNFSQGTIFKFRNNFGQTFEEVEKILKFASELKANHEHVNFNHIPIKAVTTDH